VASQEGLSSMELVSYFCVKAQSANLMHITTKGKFTSPYFLRKKASHAMHYNFFVSNKGTEIRVTSAVNISVRQRVRQ
jgi:hypothetical protein